MKNRLALRLWTLSKKAMEGKVIRGYKGFDKDLKCLDFQYEIGKEYECKKAVACKEGFHFCENPLDVLSYYEPVMSRYCEVEGSGEFDLSEPDKICCTKIKIIREISLEELIGKADFSTDGGMLSVADKDYSTVINKTNYSASVNAGDDGLACNAGFGSLAACVGVTSRTINTGPRSVATSSGCLSSTITTGVGSSAVSSGNFSNSAVMGRDSIAFVSGKRCMAKGALGCWIVLTERGEWDGECYPIKYVKAFKVEGETVKPDTFYYLKNGELVKADF